jgi:hypothetical protein
MPKLTIAFSDGELVQLRRFCLEQACRFCHTATADAAVAMAGAFETYLLSERVEDDGEWSEWAVSDVAAHNGEIASDAAADTRDAA